MSTNHELVASDDSLIQCTETPKNSQSGVSIRLNVPHSESSSHYIETVEIFKADFQLLHQPNLGKFLVIRSI